MAAITAPMNMDSTVVHYEIYVQDNGRWTLQMRFRGDERETAMDEAKAVERRLNRAVKVVRETYFPHSNTATDATVYLSSRIQSGDATLNRREQEALTKARLRRELNQFPGKKASAGAATRRGTKAPPSGIAVTFRLLLVIAIAISVSIFVVGIASVAMVQLRNMGIELSQNTYARVIFVLFIASFVFTAMPLSLFFLRDADEELIVRRRRRPRRAPRRPAPVEVLDLDDDEGEPEPEEEAQDKEADAAAEEEEEVEEETPPDEEEEEDLLELADDDEDEDAAPEESDPTGDRMRLAAMRFLAEVVAALKSDNRPLDSYTKFGLNLVMAGAVERLGEHSGLDTRWRRRMLKEVVALLGAKKSLARSFAARYEEYLLQPRYLDMVRCGRDSMAAFLDGSEQPLDTLKTALDAWNKPTPAQAGHRIVAVLFTDMVGSTDMTQRRGDHGAQEAVRRHNSIVRQALVEHDGKEIKHTGDGIMASFNSTGEAVDAACDIQRAVHAHNANVPDLPLHLRIGINAGEPIEEEDDLFGATVQLAARVCAQAGDDQILVTNVVRELSLGGGRTFRENGLHAMKGFQEPLPLFEAVWRQEEGEAAGEPQEETAEQEAKPDDAEPPAAAADAPQPDQPEETPVEPEPQEEIEFAALIGGRSVLPPDTPPIEKADDTDDKNC